MKKLIIVAAVALFTLNVSATEKPIKPNEALRTEIVNLLGNNLSFDFDKNEIITEIVFTVTNQGELVIISTNTSNKNVEQFIKKKLNYKKVDFKANPGEMFLLPIKMKNL